MIYTLENAFLQLKIDTHLSRWSVINRSQKDPWIENAQVHLQYRQGRRIFNAMDAWTSPEVSDPEEVESLHGLMSQILIDMGGEGQDLHFRLVFALPQAHPLLFWKLEIENKDDQPVQIERIEMFSTGFIYQSRLGPTGLIHFIRNQDTGFIHKLKDDPFLGAADLAFYANGWQSWSYAGTYSARDRFSRTRLGPLRTPVDVNAGSPQPRRRGLFTSEMFGVLGDRKQRAGIVFGFLSQMQQFGSLETWIHTPTPALQLWANGDGAVLNPGAKLTTDWACLQFIHLDSPDPLGPYLEAVARQHGLTEDRFPSSSPTGWCSWYQFSSEDYTGLLTAEDVRRNIESLKKLHPELALDVIQIDDGFESQIGDWFTFNPGFPEGVAPLAKQIQSAGFTPGLWLAPFIVHLKSQLASDHPDWLLHGRLGRPVNAGFLWGSFATALDMTHPEALNYASEAIDQAVHRWGFPYLKLDFLYAAALPGRFHDPTRTRAQVLRTALSTLRAAAGEQAILLGCGCPLGPAIGLVDAMRIGADTARRWLPAYKSIQTFFASETSLPAARNASHNALTRAALHRRWWINDPDCLLLNPDTKLTLAEVQTLATVIALTGGSLLLSDDIPSLPPDRIRIAKAILPLIGKRPYILDWFDHSTPQQLQLDLDGPAGHWHLVALFNWENKARNLHLDLGKYYLGQTKEYLARDFWRGDTYRISPHRTGVASLSTPGATNQGNGSTLDIQHVPPHGVCLLAIRPYRSYQAQYLGSDLHISQGLEVTGWEESQGRLNFRLERPGYAQGEIEIGLPQAPREILQGRKPLAWKAGEDNRITLPVEFDQVENFSIRY